MFTTAEFLLENPIEINFNELPFLLPYALFFLCGYMFAQKTFQQHQNTLAKTTLRWRKSGESASSERCCSFSLTRDCNELDSTSYFSGEEDSFTEDYTDDSDSEVSECDELGYYSESEGYEFEDLNADQALMYVTIVSQYMSTIKSDDDVEPEPEELDSESELFDLDSETDVELENLADLEVETAVMCETLISAYVSQML